MVTKEGLASGKVDFLKVLQGFISSVVFDARCIVNKSAVLVPWSQCALSGAVFWLALAEGAGRFIRLKTMSLFTSCVNSSRMLCVVLSGI